MAAMRKLLIGIAALLVTGAMTISESDAARVGGARSSGAQRSIAKTPPAATPAKPAQQAAPAQGQTPPAQPAPSGFAKWAPLLGGLAIGGLLGSMFGGSLGGIGGILMMALLAIGAVFVIRAFMRRREQPQTMQYAGMGEKFGEKVAMPQAQSAAEPAVSSATTVPASIPAGFDTVSFLRGAKLN